MTNTNVAECLLGDQIQTNRFACDAVQMKKSIGVFSTVDLHSLVLVGSKKVLTFQTSRCYDPKTLQLRLTSSDVPRDMEEEDATMDEALKAWAERAGGCIFLC